MTVPEIKVASYVPHDNYATKHQQVFHKPFPPVPYDNSSPPQTLPRLQTQNLNLNTAPVPLSTTLQVPAATYHAHLTPHIYQQYNGVAPSPMSSAKSTYLSVSPIEPRRERTSMQCFSTPVVSRFSQNSYEIEPPYFVTVIRLFMIRWIIEWWLMEIISWIFGTMCIAVVVGVLLMYDDHELPQWPLGITIGGFLAVFSACAKAGLLLPTAECLGQLKWNWFKSQPRSMIDFEILDTASRGPWGSVILMLRSLREKGLSLASVGAAVVILCLPLDLFFQQVVGTPKVWIPMDVQALLPRALTYEPANTEYWMNGTGPFFAPDLTLQQTMQPFIYSNGSTPDLEVTCPTSNCTWPAFETLALCNFCDDRIISELEYGCYNTSAEWLTDVSDYASYPTNYPSTTQCGWFLNATSDAPVLMTGYTFDPLTKAQGEVLETRLFPLVDANTKQTSYDGSVLFRDLVNPVLDVIIAHTPGGPAAVLENVRPVAYECAISWCTQTLESTSFEGKLQENATRMVTNNTKAPYAWKVDLETFYYEYDYNVSITPDDQHHHPTLDPQTSNKDLTFTVSNETALNFQFMLDIIMPSFVTNKPNEDVAQIKWYTLNSQGTGGAKVTPSLVTPWRNENIVRHMERIAEAMTRTIRNAVNDKNQLETIEGTAWQLKIHVEVRWAWLILPVVLAAISLVFLVVTVAKSSHDIDDVGIWKNSALAILFNGLGDDVQRSVGPNARMGEIRNKAMDLSVKIVPE